MKNVDYSLKHSCKKEIPLKYNKKSQGLSHLTSGRHFGKITFLILIYIIILMYLLMPWCQVIKLSNEHSGVKHYDVASVCMYVVDILSVSKWKYSSTINTWVNVLHYFQL